MFRWRTRGFMLPAVAALIAMASLATGTMNAGARAPHASRHHHHHVRHVHRRHHHGGIPQHNRGDHDADNNGGPSDGDGNQ
jgi:hypothetical protein